MLNARRRVSLKVCLTALSVATPLTLSVAEARQGQLPADIANVIRKQYDADTRYLDGAVDLNGDGKPEIVVHVVGPMACGSGGCPTMVFTPSDKGYRLVSTISVTRPPIKASATSTAGWRNLIVHAGGGGSKPHDVELLSNGKAYPGNPTVAGARVKPAGAGGDVIIKEFKDFSETRELPKAGASMAAPPPATASSEPSAAGVAGRESPSFDCARATAAVEKLICGDAALAKLDRTLAASYTRALGNFTDTDKAAERTAQRAWIASRNGCAKDSDAKACVQASYQRRLVEMRIKGGELMAPTPVGFACKGQESQPFTVAFYNDVDPRAAVITLGNRQTIAFAAQAASGARYTNNEIEYWEHQGEATVKWSGKTMVCKPR